MSETTYQTSVCLRADHPALAGHFPDNPIVPGVMLLERVANAVQEWRGQRVTCVNEAKFMQPLKPDQHAELDLRDTGARIGFTIRRGETLVARGSVTAVMPENEPARIHPHE